MSGRFKGRRAWIKGFFAGAASYFLVGPTSAQTSAKRELSVLTYGAKGDGVFDDTRYIQRALNESNGCRLLFPKTGGFYKVTDTLVVPENYSLELFVEGTIGLNLSGGERARNVFFGQDVESISLTGGGVIDGGGSRGGLIPSGSNKSTMAAVYFKRKSQGGTASVSNLKVINSYTAASVFDNYSSVTVLDYSAIDCGVGHFGTQYAGESIVVKSAQNVDIKRFYAKGCTDGAGLLICQKVTCNDARFESCAIGFDVPNCRSVTVDGLYVIDPIICGMTSVAWGTPTIQRGASRLIVKNIDVKSSTGKGVGIAIDSTDYAEVTGAFDGLRNGVVVKRSFFNQKFNVPRSGKISLNVNVKNCSGAGVIVGSADSISISGRFFNNSLIGKGGGGQVVVDARDDLIGDLDISIDSSDLLSAKGAYVVIDGDRLERLSVKGALLKDFFSRSKFSPSIRSRAVAKGQE